MTTKEKKKRTSLLSKLLLAANAVVLTGLAMGFLAAYIPPDKLWIFAFAGIAFPYLALINVVFIFIWMVAGKKYFFVSLAALLICWNRLTGFIQFNKNGEREKTENSIKVVSYNVRIFDRYNWNSKRISKTAEDILKLTRTLEPDILCLQEYHAGRKGSADMEDSIIKYTGLKYRHIEYAKYKGKTKAFGIATYSRWPVISSHIIPFERNPVNFCIYNDIVFQQDTIRIFNIHLESIQLSREDYLFVSELTNQAEDKALFSENSKKILRKFKQAFIFRASEAREVEEQIKLSPYPVIVCGDFNDTPSSYTYRKMSEGLSDAFRESGSGFGQTYAGRFPSFRIDYILHDPDMQSYGFRRTRVPLSDHYPVSTFITIHGKKNPE
ncbi:MAG: endonuclease/exonuclease/phosphatase family protein [Bacteroidota bacterium]